MRPATRYGLLLLSACQPGMSTTPAVAPLPRQALGLSVYLAAEPTVVAVDDADGRPIAMTLQHSVRDALEEAGFRLAPTAESGNVRATVVIQHVGTIEADLFIKGARACGVRLDVARGDTLLASAQPEVACLATSPYYGMLPKDAAISLVNTVSHAPAFLSVAEALRTPAPPP